MVAPRACRSTANKSVSAIPFPKFVQQCLSLLCAVAGNGCHAGRTPHLVVGNGLTRNGLPLLRQRAESAAVIEENPADVLAPTTAAATRSRSAAMPGPMMSGCPILSHGLFARLRQARRRYWSRRARRRLRSRNLCTASPRDETSSLFQ